MARAVKSDLPYELSLYRSMREISSAFEKAFAHTLTVRKWRKHFEVWLWCIRGTSRVLIPLADSKSIFVERSKDLIRKLVLAGRSEGESVEHVEGLYELCGRLNKQCLPDKGLSPAKKEVVTKQCKEDKTYFTYEDVTMELNTAYYEKLKALFLQNEDFNRGLDLDHQVMCLLLRYSTAQGTNGTSGGCMQAALYDTGFQVLKKEFGVQVLYLYLSCLSTGYLTIFDK